MNMYLRGFLLLIVGFGIGFLLSSFLSHSWPFPASFFETKPATVQKEEEKKQEANIVEPRLTAIIVNDTECPVISTIENPFLSGEYIAETKDGCFSGTNSAFLFLKKTGEEAKPLLARGAYEYPFDNPMHEKEMPIVTFLSANEILYGSAYGEGMDCQAGGELVYNKLNLDTGETTTLAKYSAGSQCHNARALKTAADYENACMDENTKYAFEQHAVEIKIVCEKALNPSNKLLTLSLDGKKITEKPLTEGDEYIFNGLTNTTNLLRKNKNVQFLINQNLYSVNLDTGFLSS